MYATKDMHPEIFFISLCLLPLSLPNAIETFSSELPTAGANPFWVEGSASSSVIRWVLAIMSNVNCFLSCQGSFERTEESNLYPDPWEEMVGQTQETVVLLSDSSSSWALLGGLDEGMCRTVPLSHTRAPFLALFPVLEDPSIFLDMKPTQQQEPLPLEGLSH